MRLWAHGVPCLLAACSRQACQLSAALLEECAEGDGRRRQAQELVEQLRPAVALGAIQRAHKQDVSSMPPGPSAGQCGHMPAHVACQCGPCSSAPQSMPARSSVKPRRQRRSRTSVTYGGRPMPSGLKVKVKVGKSLHRLNFPVLTSSFRPLFDLPDAPSAVPPTGYNTPDAHRRCSGAAGCGRVSLAPHAPDGDAGLPAARRPG